ncbi:MAG: hypothetical protein PHF60_03190 [Candidatus ainarchaeum sp.]|nr:hypothetical protein [Candidatus ainarchaeum sp.]
MVITKQGDARNGGKEPSLRELGELAKQAAYASVRRFSQAPRIAGVAEKEISDYITIVEDMKRGKSEEIGRIQERAAGERMGRSLILQGEACGAGRTMTLLDEEIGLLQKASSVVEKMETRIAAIIDSVSDNPAQKALFSIESRALGAKIVRLTTWLSQRKEIKDKEDKDIIGEIAYLKAYLGIKKAEM